MHKPSVNHDLFAGLFLRHFPSPLHQTKPSSSLESQGSAVNLLYQNLHISKQALLIIQSKRDDFMIFKWVNCIEKVICIFTTNIIIDVLSKI